MLKRVRWCAVATMVLTMGGFMWAPNALAQLPPLPPITPETLAFLDTNHDGAISLSEVQAMFPFVTAQMFAMLDANGDGVLSADDFTGPEPPFDAAAVLNHLLEAADANHDGSVSYAEAVAIVPILSADQFDLLDANGDGVLNDADLPSGPPANPEGLLRNLLDAADTNGDGSVSFPEAKALVPELTQTLFNLLDRNSDGVLSEADIPEGPPPENPFAVLGHLLDLADTNADGCISYEEALAIVPGLPRALFDFLDRDASGCLDAADVPPGPIPMDEIMGLVTQLFHLADTNGDGAISFEEAAALIPGLPLDLFNFLDRNDDGVLSPADLPTPPGPGGTLDLLLNLLGQADANGDGAVSYDEALAVAPDLPRELFEVADLNDDGVLSLDDLPASPPQGGAVELFLRIVNEADTNGDGAISYEEAAAVVPGLSHDIFNFLDQNGDGVLSEADLPGATSDGNLIALLVQLVHQADTNGDGAISFEEASALVPGLPEELFNRLDQNGDGVLSPADLPAPPPSGNPIEVLMGLLTQADANHDGEVTLEELRTVIPQFTEERFQILDANDDGVLSLADLPSGPIPIEGVLSLLRLADANRDGEVSFDELKAVIPALTQEQFDQLDQNGDGVLSPEDLPAPPPEDPIARLLRLLHDADADGDGQVTLAELQAVIPGFTQAAFDALDLNGDGVLSRDDLPPGPPPGPRELLLRLLRAADANNDGQVTFDELHAIIPELTRDQFDRLDRNGDGVLSADDAPPFESDPIERLLHFLREADANGDGQVTFEELQAALPGLTQQQFNMLDLNGDGVLSMDDVPPPPADPLARLIALLRAADADHNGEVTNAEFLAGADEVARQMFDCLDGNGDGVLSAADLAKSLPDPLDRLVDLLHAADTDQNGEVTLDEFLAVAQQAAQLLFDRLDTNGDGVISPADLPQPPEDPRDRLLRLLRDADADHNGEVTFAELQSVLPELTTEQFDQIDRNHDGVLSAADLEGGCVPSEDELREQLLRLFVCADTNQDGLLEYDEIAAVFPDAPAELLGTIDTNGDWALSREELMEALSLGIDGKVLVHPSDLNANGATDAVDLQIVVNYALGLAGDVLLPDINGNGRVDAVDVQRVVNGVLGLG